MKIVRFSAGRLAGFSRQLALVAMLGTIGSASADAQAALKTDKSSYAEGEPITVTLTGAGSRQWRRVLVWLRGNGSNLHGSRFLYLDMPGLFRGSPVSFFAPYGEGRWRIELHSAGPSESLSEATLAARAEFEIVAPTKTAEVAPEARAGRGTQSSSSSGSARGDLSMVEPHIPVLGEMFAVSMPFPGADTNLVLRWRRANDTVWGHHWMPNELIRTEGRVGTHVHTVVAPTGRPGKYELGLFLHWTNNYLLIDVLPVEVQTGTAPDGVQLFKEVFQPGDPIEFRVKLPPNRYYQGNWYGPTVVLYPLVVEGKPVEGKEAWGMAKTMALNFLVFDQGKQDVFSSNRLGKAVRPGTYTVTHDTVAKYRLHEALFAPRQSGRWEVRLYDRGYPSEDYLDLVLAADTMVVEPVGVTPTQLRFVRTCGTGSADIAQLMHDEPFQVEARFEGLPASAATAEKTGTFAFIDALGEPRTRQFTLTRASTGIYCSPVLKLAEPTPGTTRGRTP
jgi:hypothetical protein